MSEEERGRVSRTSRRFAAEASAHASGAASASASATVRAFVTVSTRIAAIRAFAGALAVAVLAASVSGCAPVKDDGAAGAGETATRTPLGIMGTSCRLAVVPGRGADAAAADAALASAERALRSVEAKISSWLWASEISELNRAPLGETVRVSGETLDLLSAARAFHERSGGAFDVTCGPLVDLWREAAKSQRVPTEGELARARALAGWAGFELRTEGAVRLLEGARIDLGGIGKGYGIDRAVESMVAREEVAGGLVDVGGDLRVFGRAPQGGAWRVGLRAPSAEVRVWAAIRIGQGAVCTSGHYERHVEIDGTRYSHIVDPRTGRPVDPVTVSVTVWAPTAVAADAWATTLTVLGAAGLSLLDDVDARGVEALVVTQGSRGLEALATRGFPEVEPLEGFPPLERL